MFPSLNELLSGGGPRGDGAPASAAAVPAAVTATAATALVINA